MRTVVPVYKVLRAHEIFTELQCFMSKVRIVQDSVQQLLFCGLIDRAGTRFDVRNYPNTKAYTSKQSCAARILILGTFAGAGNARTHRVAVALLLARFCLWVLEYRTEVFQRQGTQSTYFVNAFKRRRPLRR